MSEPKKTGETQRYTFRVPDASIAKLDDLVAEKVKEDGSGDRTTVLLELIAKAHAAIKRKRGEK